MFPVRRIREKNSLFDLFVFRRSRRLALALYSVTYSIAISYTECTSKTNGEKNLFFFVYLFSSSCNLTLTQRWNRTRRKLRNKLQLIRRRESPVLMQSYILYPHRIRSTMKKASQRYQISTHLSSGKYLSARSRTLSRRCISNSRSWLLDVIKFITSTRLITTASYRHSTEWRMEMDWWTESNLSLLPLIFFSLYCALRPSPVLSLHE